MNDYWNQDNPFRVDQNYQSPEMGQGAIDQAAGLSKPPSAPPPSVGEGAAKGAAAGAATGNPWVAGGMAAMGALSAGLERKRKEREMEYMSRVERLKSIQEALGNAQQMASRISY